MGTWRLSDPPRLCCPRRDCSGHIVTCALPGTVPVSGVCDRCRETFLCRVVVEERWTVPEDPYA